MEHQYKFLLHKHRLRNVPRDTDILLILGITNQEAFHQEYVNWEDILWGMAACHSTLETSHEHGPNSPNFKNDVS